MNEDFICARMVRHTVSLVSIALGQPSDRLELKRLCSIRPNELIKELPEEKKRAILDFISTYDRQADRIQMIEVLLRETLVGNYVHTALNQLRGLEQVLREMTNAEKLGDILNATRSVESRIDVVHTEANTILEHRDIDINEYIYSNNINNQCNDSALQKKSASYSSASEVTFTILHLTDLHWRVNSSERRWRDVEKPFLDDLKQALQTDRLLDLVVFSGDLTFSGKMEEYKDGVDQLCNKLWHIFAQCGSHPPLLSVPGNHDLCRPFRKLDSLKGVFEIDSSEESVFSHKQSDESIHISEAFKHWIGWHKDNINYQHNNNSLINGKYNDINTICPGDFSYRHIKRGRKLGVVGLNSSFLQLDGGDYEQKIALDSSQLHAACGENGRDWYANNDANILVTHHPPSWLHPKYVQHFWNDVCIAGTVDLHLHGHLHNIAYNATGRQPGELTHRIQGISLFGEEKFCDSKNNTMLQRLHGYVLIQIIVAPNANRFRFRPIQFTDDKRPISPPELEVDKSTGWTHWVSIPKRNIS